MFMLKPKKNKKNKVIAIKDVEKKPSPLEDPYKLLTPSWCWNDYINRQIVPTNLAPTLLKAADPQLHSPIPNSYKLNIPDNSGGSVVNSIMKSSCPPPPKLFPTPLDTDFEDILTITRQRRLRCTEKAFSIKDFLHQSKEKPESTESIFSQETVDENDEGPKSIASVPDPMLSHKYTAHHFEMVWKSKNVKLNESCAMTITKKKQSMAGSKFYVPVKIANNEAMWETMKRYLHNDLEIQIESNFYYVDRYLFTYYAVNFRGCTGSFLQLPVQKVQISQIAKLYEWMLCEGKPFPAGPEAISIFSAAKFLGIEDLMEQYWTAFSRKGELAIWEMTAFHIYLLAKELRCSEIMTVMFGRIRKCFLPLVASWEFLEFNVNEVTCMLSNDMLCVNSEDEIFFAAFYWLDFAWNERKKHAVKVMSAVRFGILSPWLRRSICNVPENDRIGEIGQLPEVCRWLWQGTMVSQAIVVDGQKSQDKYVKMHLDEWQRHKIPERYWIYCLGVPHHHDYKCSRFRELTYETFKRFLHSLHAHAQIFMDSLQFVPNKIWNTYRCCVDVTYRPYRDRNCRKPQFYSKGKKI